jgi:hypothetical protein
MTTCVSQTWNNLAFNRHGIVVANADTTFSALYEYARVNQCLVRTLLNTEMYDVSLLYRCVGCVDQRELLGATMEYKHASIYTDTLWDGP